MTVAVGVEKMRAALGSASAIGPYFAVELSAAQDDWHDLADLWTEPGCAEGRVDAARQFLRARAGAEIELRACASISSLGLVSRLVSPALATACSARLVPRLAPPQVRWRPVDSGPIPIAFVSVNGTAVDSAVEAAAELEYAVLLSCVEPILTTYAKQFRLSLRLLRGNVASALAGAAGMLVKVRRPLRFDPIEVVDAMLARPLLSGAGHYELPFDERPERFFVRDNCCLFYRIPGAGTCGDCVLVPRSARLEMWRAAVATPDRPADP